MRRRSIVAAMSISVHAIILVFAMTADLWRPITGWPTPRAAIVFAYDTPRPVHLADIELPRPALRTVANGTSSSAPPTASPSPIEVAPIAPESGIRPDNGNNGMIAVPSSGVGSLGDHDNVVFGPPVAPTPPSAPRAQTPVRLHSGIRAPQRIVNVTPVYPAVARSARVDGIVIIEATIDEQGNVIRTQVLRSIPLLDDAALAAVRQWKFTPTLLNGVAVPIVMTVTVNFKLD
jgi:protein TonB